MMLEARCLTIKGRLEAVSARIAPGTITAICGPNGAGKSTFLSALAGLQKADGGEVLLAGEDLLSLRPKQRAKVIGYLPQYGEAAWNLCVRSLAALGRLPHGDGDTDDGAKQVASALDALDLADLAQRPMSTLSGGEKARALLARVLAGEPRWILADEPLAALDLGHQLALLGHLRRVADSGVGVVLVLHDLALAMNHADHVLVLNNGELAAQGAPQAALSPDIIECVWQVKSRWLGEAGARALAAG